MPLAWSFWLNCTVSQQLTCCSLLMCFTIGTMNCNATQYSPREYIARHDDQVDYWYVIDSGQVDFVSHLDADLSFIRYSQGDCFGEVRGSCGVASGATCGSD